MHFFIYTTTLARARARALSLLLLRGIVVELAVVHEQRTLQSVSNF